MDAEGDFKDIDTGVSFKVFRPLMGWTGRAPERSPKGLNSKHKEPSHEGKR